MADELHPNENLRKTAVVGIGNLLMGDEGVGVQAIWALERERLPPEIKLFDAGTAFHALVGQLAGFDKLIIVDAVRGGGPPGTIYRFGLEEMVERTKQAQAAPGFYPPLSLHDIGVIEELMMERLAESASPADEPYPPDELHPHHRSPDFRSIGWSLSAVIIGIEPAKIEPSLDLSTTVQQQLPAVVQTVLGELDTRRNDRDCL